MEAIGPESSVDSDAAEPVEQARDLFRKVAAGQSVPEETCRRLAEAVLTDELYTRASAVLQADGRHRLRHTLELAAILLSRAESGRTDSNVGEDDKQGSV